MEAFYGFETYDRFYCQPGSCSSADAAVYHIFKKLSFKQSVSEYALEDDQKKAGTPIMGGVLFILVPILVTLVAFPSSMKDLNVWIIILAFVGYGLIGFIDDFLIAVKKE